VVSRGAGRVVGSAGGGEGGRLLVRGIAGGTTAATGAGTEGTAPGGPVAHHGFRGVGQPWMQCCGVEVRRPAHLVPGGHPSRSCCCNTMQVHQHSQASWKHSISYKNH
jgi:hypothetical protein